MTVRHGISTIAVALIALTPGWLAPEPATATPPRVLLAFLPVDDRPADEGGPEVPETGVLERLDLRSGLSLGLLGAVQGTYSPEQALLDISQGTRTSAAAYTPRRPPDLEVYTAGPGGLFVGWLDVNARAQTALADIHPGLLAESIPGGVGYAGVIGRAQVEAIAAADRAGRIERVVLTTASDIADAVRNLLTEHRMVVAGLPTGTPGDVALDALLSAREPEDLVLVVQTPPEANAPQLLPMGMIGNGVPGALRSRTTRLDGVVAGIDVLPTALEHLGIPVPDDVKGQPIRPTGERDAGALQDLDDRLRVVGPRRFPALETVLAVWLVLVLVGSLVADHRGVRFALRIGALAFLWVLPVLLFTALLHPARGAEMALIAGISFVLALLTDRFLPWPRGPLLPGLITPLVYVIDLARGSDLIIRSLLGPNPRFGSRYYGIGNELEATLPVLLLIGLGVLLAGRGRSTRSAVVVGLSGVALAGAIGWGKMGADVGGVITVGAGFAAAVLLLLPGGVTRARLALALATPAVALGGLAVLDLATGGDGHFTRSVLRADDGGALWDTIERRYTLAYRQLIRGLMPFATLIALLTIAWALRYRARLYAPLEGDPAWRAALVGGLVAGIAGTLFNDSGPVLLLFSTFTLAAATIYVRGDTSLAGVGAPARLTDGGDG